MGRPRKEIDMETLLDLSERGLNQKELAEALGISIPTLAGRITELQQEQGILLQYRNLRNLHLTKLQARCLEAITVDKITEASLIDLARSFKILHDAETETSDGGKVKGLVAYLIQIEKEEAATRLGAPVSDSQLLDMAEKQTAEDSFFELSGLFEEVEV